MPPATDFTAMADQAKPWHLSRIPNYDAAPGLETVHADQLDEASFRRDYVARNRACLIKGAARHWPACAKWGSVDYLKQQVPDVAVPVRAVPISEYSTMAEPALQAELRRRNDASYDDMSFHDFLDRARDQAGQLVLQGISLKPELPLGTLCADLDGYPFLPQPGGSRMYAPYRAFFYRESYTDWHYHPTDETLMTQVVGAKEVLILPPTQQSWDALWPVARQRGYLFDIDTAAFPAAAAMRPLRAIVEAGDALYIPPFWWHVVAPCDDQFGVTVAATFRTPLHINGDLRFPGARQLFKRRIWSRFAPLILAAICYSYLYRIVPRAFR